VLQDGPVDATWTTQPPTDQQQQQHWTTAFFAEDYLRIFGPFVEGARADEESARVQDLLGCAPGARVLDLACGQGRHAAPLRRAGLDVVGLDLSEVLLRAARRREDRLPLVRADMRRLPLATATFDGVVNLFNAFGYFPDDESDVEVLREVARVLRPGGTFVQEVHHRDALVLGWEERTTHPTYDDGLVVTEERVWDSVQGRHRVRYLLSSDGGEPRVLDHELRVYTITELVDMHRRAGLQVQAVHGDLAGAPATPRTPLAVLVSTAAG